MFDVLLRCSLVRLPASLELLLERNLQKSGIKIGDPTCSKFQSPLPVPPPCSQLPAQCSHQGTSDDITIDSDDICVSQHRSYHSLSFGFTNPFTVDRVRDRSNVVIRPKMRPGAAGEGLLPMKSTQLSLQNISKYAMITVDLPNCFQGLFMF